MRSDERCACRALAKLLRTTGSSARWRSAPDPPDAWIQVDGTRFAVEVTQVHRVIRRGTYRGTEAKTEREDMAFFRSAIDRAFDDDIIRGCYHVRMAPIENLRGAKGL